jgi:hypothetical protein
MRLRTTAPPSAFLMLNPKRLSGSWFARKKTVKWEFERRLPVRYTASNSPRRTIRAARGNFRPSGLLGREPMASLLAARRQYFAASDGLHAYAKSVRLGAPPFIRLICSLWQSNPPLVSVPVPAIIPCSYYVAREFVVSPAARLALSTRMGIRRQAASAAYSESISVVDPRARGQENCGVAYRVGESDTANSLGLLRMEDLAACVRQRSQRGRRRDLVSPECFSKLVRLITRELTLSYKLFDLYYLRLKQ